MLMLASGQTGLWFGGAVDWGRWHTSTSLSMIFIIATYLLWCNYLHALDGVQPQLCADNLKMCHARLGATR